MSPKSKKLAYRRLIKLEDFFFLEKESGEMKTEEYNWIKDHMMNIISSISNFDDENMQECEQRMEMMGLTKDELDRN